MKLIRHHILLFACLALIALGAFGLVHAQQVDNDADVGHVAELTIEGAIGPATTDYLLRSMEQADEAGAHAILIRMDTPGGLDAATRDIIQAILASPLPVITYVHPAGARAASAGTYILYGSHIAAMTPATSLGAATPVQMGGPLPEAPEPDEEGGEQEEEREQEGADEEAEAEEQERDQPLQGTAMERKVINDSVAFIRGLAERHGRNADWAERAVREAVSLTASEALEKNVIDVLADNRENLLAQLEGREVQLEDRTMTLATADMPIESYAPDWRNELLAVITNPQIASILLLIGIYGLLLEGYNPGTMVPGIIGAISLLLGLYAMQILPINYVGLALLILGGMLILAEAFVPSFGVLGIGGVVAVVMGSIMLVDTDVPGMEVSYEIVGALAVLSILLLIGVMTVVGRTLRMPKRRSGKGTVGRETQVVQVTESGVCKVRLDGEYWNAESDEPLQPGDIVTVTEQSGLRLKVKKT